MAATYNGRAVNKAPISQHPAFPAIVALWFAALLGIGSLVLPVALFENLSIATGLSAAVSAAEPPLGVAARILIALAGAGLGAIAGLYIARKVVAAQAAPRRTPRETTASRAAKRPISAHEELGAESFDEPVEDARRAPIPGRRRPLSVTSESGPSELLDYAPLPGADAEIVLPAADAFASQPAPAEDDALELAVFADRGQPAESPEPVESAEKSGDDHMVTPAVPYLEAAADQARRFDAPPVYTSPEIASSSERESADIDAATDSPREEIDLAAVPESIPFAAPPSEFRADDSELADVHEVDEPPLGELSIAELVGRFALSLQRAAERTEAKIEAEPAAEELPARYVPDLGVEAVEAPRFAPPPAPWPDAAVSGDDAPGEAIPAALRPVALDEEVLDDEEDLALTLTLPHETRPFARPATERTAAAPPAGDGEIEEYEDAPLDGAYSSLLSIRKPEGQREFVRIDEDDEAIDGAVEPVVIFPGQEERRAGPAYDQFPHEPAAAAPHVPADRPFDAPARLRAAPAASEAPAVDQTQAERALREALHKLQRLSGAA